ncbi:peptidoglycan D,D-transpeptidase FtsI family protein [Patescibacteria group bacterium]
MNFRFRLLFISLFFVFSGFLLLARLFYWQILASDKLVEIAQSQQQTTIEIPAKRGEILFSDGSFLATNQPAYFSYLSRQNDQSTPPSLSKNLSEIVYSSITFSATPSTQLSNLGKEKLIVAAQDILDQRLSNQNLVWVPIARKLTEPQKWAIEGLGVDSLLFEEETSRLYPEASMAAHLVGFVGSNEQGRDTGYHGLEGFYQHELAGRSGIVRQEKDAFNQPILMGKFLRQQQRDGRSLKLHLNKSLQYLVEKKLQKSIDQFGAKSGSVAIMDPKTGAILAMASFPSYDPVEYISYNRELFPNPVVADAFEPGSIFKVIVMAAALDAEAIKPDTKCDICHGPVKIDKYEIETWNKEYRPDSTMTDVIVNSDNVGMVFIGQKLGQDKFLDYFDKFGLNDPTGIDLQDEVVAIQKTENQFTYVDLATASFGQGFVSTSMQLLQAVSAIANDGELIQPKMVDQVISGTREITIPTKSKGRVISKKAANQVTEMMIAAAKDGEAKWVAKTGYQIAGKTGTAQIAVKGKYHEAKTNASFVGFAPADDPKFVMLVTLKEPSTSQWASETAAPLWFSIAQDLLDHFNVIPNQ